MNRLGFEEEIVNIEYESEHDLAIYTFVVNLVLEDLYKKDIENLTYALEAEEGDDRREAIEELLKSLRKSLEVGIGNNPAYTKKGTYEHVAPGFKMHKETGDLYISGILTNKILIEEKKPRKETKSSQKTITKNEIRRKYMTSHKFREFKVDRVRLGLN